MIETICSIELPVGEKFRIEKNRICCENASGQEERVAIVSGIHGDELEGQYICYETVRRLKEHPEYLKGIVDIYPKANPLGIDLAQRNIPKLEMDMNRMFPGSTEGDLMERAAASLVDDIVGAGLCIDVHASDQFVREIPQVRVRTEFAKKLLPYAELMNVDMVWINAMATVHESALSYTLNMLGVPTLVGDMGLGIRISRTYGDQVVDGIFNLMKEMGIWTGPVKEVKKPIVSTDGEVTFFRAEHSGVFLPAIEHRHHIRKGDKIGEIIDVLTGTVIQEILTDKDGLVFTMREYPFVYEGALLARLLTGIA